MSMYLRLDRLSRQMTTGRRSASVDGTRMFCISGDISVLSLYSDITFNLLIYSFIFLPLDGTREAVLLCLSTSII